MKNLHFSVIGIYLDFDGVKKKSLTEKEKRPQRKSVAHLPKETFILKFTLLSHKAQARPHHNIQQF